MQTGVIESISKTSLVVTTTDNKTITLTGKVVEEVAGNYKLGDSIDYTMKDDGATATSISKTSKKAAAATPAPAAKRGSSSPAVKVSNNAIAGAAAAVGETW